jgi:3-hydroxyisobutyrate dehydrogenase-like beta-hydroxyacid dehydrogenase
MGTRTIGLVGLGLLGGALAERFLRAGYGVCGFDIDPARRRALTQLGGSAAESAAEVAAACDRVVLSLPTSDVVKAVTRQLLPHLRAGTLLLDTTTGDPERTAGLGAELAGLGFCYLDATVSGSSEQVRAGDAVVMVGGERVAVERGVDLLAAFAREWFHLGPWGAGSRMKLVSNLVLGLNRLALAEGLAFARACGVGPAQALRVLRAAASYSRVMDTKGRKMVEEDFAPQAKLDQHLKDVRLILAEGRRAGAKLPLTELHGELLEHLSAAGLGEADNSAVLVAFRPSPGPGPRSQAR